MNKKKIIIILLFIIMLIIVVVVGTKVPGIITKEMKYKEFQKIETVETLGELEYAEDENMANVKNMEFVYQNNTGVKVNSISITDDTLKANVSFKVDKDFEYRTFSYIA